MEIKNLTKNKNMPKYFHFHTQKVTREDPELIQFDAPLQSVRCSFIKKNGQQCKKKCMIGTPMCRQHLLMKYRVTVKKSSVENAGLGLFAEITHPRKVVFKKNNIIVPYDGERIDKAELDRRYGNNYTAPYALQVSDQIYEDGALRRGVGTLVNHSAKKKNAKLDKEDGVGFVRATKNINSGEEIFVDYGEDYNLAEDGVISSTNGNKKKA